MLAWARGTSLPGWRSSGRALDVGAELWGSARAGKEAPDESRQRRALQCQPDVHSCGLRGSSVRYQYDNTLSSLGEITCE